MERRPSGTFRLSGEHPIQLHHEVKGLFFVVARKHLMDRYGVESIRAMAEVMSPKHREAMLQPMHSEWYAEEALQEALGAFHEVVARGRDEEVLTSLAACTVDGVNRFFQVLLGMASPSFLLRKCPVLWRFARRGPSTVTVEADEERAVVSYRDFPYFDDRNYRLMMEGTLRGVAGLGQPRGGLHVKSVHWDKGSLDVEVLYP